jgi:hypothetical protein
MNFVKGKYYLIGDNIVQEYDYTDSLTRTHYFIQYLISEDVNIHAKEMFVTEEAMLSVNVSVYWLQRGDKLKLSKDIYEVNCIYETTVKGRNGLTMLENRVALTDGNTRHMKMKHASSEGLLL